MQASQTVSIMEKRGESMIENMDDILSLFSLVFLIGLGIYMYIKLNRHLESDEDSEEIYRELL